MSIHLTKRIIIQLIVLGVVLVVGAYLIIHRKDISLSLGRAANNFSVNFTETGKGPGTCVPVGDAERYIRYDISARNDSNDPYQINYAAFHNDTAGCAAYDGSVGSGFTKISGKTDYAPGESDTLVLRYDTNTYTCGRVQYDAGYYRTDIAYDSTVFLAVVVDYGQDCTPEVTPPPTPTPTPLTPIIPTPACSDSNYTVQISYPDVNNDIRIFIDDAPDMASSWDKVLSGASGSTAAPAGFNPRLPGMPALTLQPGVRYYSLIQNGSSEGPTVNWIVNTCPTPTPTANPTPTPVGTPVPTSTPPPPTPTPPPSGGGGGYYSPPPTPTPFITPSPTPTPLAIPQVPRSGLGGGRTADSSSGFWSSIASLFSAIGRVISVFK